MKLSKVEYVTLRCMLSLVSFEFSHASYMILHIRALLKQ